MRRFPAWLFPAVLIAVCAIAPILAAISLSRALVTYTELDRLAIFDKRIIQRAKLAFAGATDALHRMARTQLSPCSPDHIDLMRDIVANNRFIGEAGYFDDDGVLKCTSWGPTNVKIARMPPDFETDDGIDVVVSLTPSVVRTPPRMALFLGNYNVLVDPKELADVVVTPGIQLAIASSLAGLLATLNDPDPELVASLLADPRKGSNEAYLFAAGREGNLIGIAIQSRANTLSAVERARSLLLPVATLVSAALAAAAFWAMRKKTSPRNVVAAAIRRRAFTVHYQPVIELATNACVGAEALVRWQRRDGSFVSPDWFIPIAEEAGLVCDITDQVIDRVVADLGEAMCGNRRLHVGINVSAADITSGRVLAKIQPALAGTGISNDQIWLELTERGFVDIERARATIVEAHRRGHRVAIDDFGTGYSSLQYLQSLPLDALKIDKSFIDSIGRITATSSVTAHIIDMARTLGLTCVAEGVETQQQLDYLKKQGVPYGQGWLFSKALPPDEFLAFCRTMGAEGRARSQTPGSAIGGNERSGSA